MFFKKPYIVPPRTLSILSVFIALSVAFSLSLSACSDDSTGPDLNDGDNNNGGNPPSASVVLITGQTFSPGNLGVEVGTTATWENDNSDTHTVTSGSNSEHDGGFNSGHIPPGEEYSYTFNEPGVFDYFCIPHPGMDATVTVVESD